MAELNAEQVQTIREINLKELEELDPREQKFERFGRTLFDLALNDVKDLTEEFVKESKVQINPAAGDKGAEICIEVCYDGVCVRVCI